MYKISVFAIALSTIATIFAVQSPARSDEASYNACIGVAAQVRDQSIANGMPRDQADAQWQADVERCGKYLDTFQPESNPEPHRTGGSGTR